MKIGIIVFGLLIMFLLTGFSSFASERSDADKFEDAHPVDVGFFKGTVTSVTDGGKAIRFDVGIKNGLTSEKHKNKKFTVMRQNMPVAIISLSDIGQGESSGKVEKAIEGITLKAGDAVTSEENALDIRDLKLIDNPYCELMSKTFITENSNYQWNIEPLTLEILGDSYLFTSYDNPNFGKGRISLSDDHCFLYLFDKKGEKKWGYYTNACIWKDFDIEFKLFNRDVRFSSEPNYKIYGDKLYVNGYRIVRDVWVPLKYIKKDGIFVNLDLKSGKEIWRVYDKNDDAAFYSVIYDNFIEKICYLGATNSILYGLNLEKGSYLWEYKMSDEAPENSNFYFDEKEKFVYTSDKNGFIYKIAGKTGQEAWKYKADSPVIKMRKSDGDKENVIYCFDSEKSICAVNTDTGSLVWKYESPGRFITPKLNQISGNVIYAFDESGLAALGKDTGKVNWRAEMKSPSPVYLNTGGILFCISGKKSLQAVNTSGGKINWTYEGKDEISNVINIKGAIYILDKGNVYCLDETTGKEVWQKNDLESPVYLQKYKAKEDPYNIMTLGKIDNESSLIFIGSRKGYISIDPSLRKIVSENKFEDEFVRAIGDDKYYYLISKKHVWTADSTTGKLKWNRAFENEITFVAAPDDGQVYYTDDEFFNVTKTINSRSRKLIGMEAGKIMYILNKETGEIVKQGSEEEFLYPYLEMEAMNKIGEEKIKGVYFYSYGDCLYTLRSK